MWRGLLLGMALGGLLIAGVPTAVSYFGSTGVPAVGIDRDGPVRAGISALFRFGGGNGDGEEDGSGGSDGGERDEAEAGPDDPAEGGDAGGGDAQGGDAGDGEAAADEAARADLAAKLGEIFRRHGPPGTYGLVIMGPHGEVITEHHADQPLIPASTQKLVTAALALEKLGPDHRLRTELHATGPVRDGVVHGDLIVVGGGDPALGDPLWGRVLPQRPRTPLEGLAGQIAESGVREVHGQVIGLASVLPWEPQPPGWPSRYLANGDTSLSSGLTVNGGRRLRQRGGRVRGEPADSPALETARSLRALLNERGVLVAGEPGVINELPDGTEAVGAVDSPPLVELLRYMVRHSDNHLADTLWRVAGRQDGDGSWASGARAAAEMLEGMGIDAGPAELVDGSGLSRDNRLTVRQLALLDQRMTADYGAVWDGLKAVSAEAGTLRRRLHGTLAAGQLHAKTGSLNDVRALAGAVHGPEGRWHMAIVANGLDGAGIRRFRRLSDDLAVGLARQARGCDVLAGC